MSITSVICEIAVRKGAAGEVVEITALSKWASGQSLETSKFGEER